MGTAAGEVVRKGHIFLSHAGVDTQAARQFAEILRRNGLDVWFDKDNLQPGDPWTATLEDAISNASAMIVYIGSLGIQAWVDREVRYGLVRNTKGADAAKLPPFVQQQQYVDLRDRQRTPGADRAASRDPPEPIIVPDCDPGGILDHAQPVSESPDFWPRGLLAVLRARPRHRRVAHAPGPRSCSGRNRELRER